MSEDITAAAAAQLAALMLNVGCRVMGRSMAALPSCHLPAGMIGGSAQPLSTREGLRAWAAIQLRFEFGLSSQVTLVTRQTCLVASTCKVHCCQKQINRTFTGMRSPSAVA